MKEAVSLAKEADAKKDFSPTKSDDSIHYVRNAPERQLGSLMNVINNIKHDGGTPSVDSIATELGSMHAAQRAPALLALQQTHGNRYVQRVVMGIQAKLKIGQPGDIYEQEADRVADEVMRMPELKVQQQPEEEEEEPLQAKTDNLPTMVQRQSDDAYAEEELKREQEELAAGIQAKREASNSYSTPYNATSIMVDGANVNGSLTGGGRALPSSTRSLMGSYIGHDFSSVRVYDGPDANNYTKRLGAKAMTSGKDIYFAAGWYRPNTLWGKRLLAHELTHVVQQSRMTRIQSSLHIFGHPGDRYELEADAVGEALVRKLEAGTPGVDRPHISKLPAAAGVQAAGPHVPTQVKASGPLTEKQLNAARAWYLKLSGQYTTDVIKQIQEKVRTAPDGIIGPFTIQAVAKWQKSNNLTVDGKAGSTTLLTMFGKDIRPGTEVKEEKIEEKGEETSALIGFLRPFLKYSGITDEEIHDLISGKEPTKPAGKEPTKPAGKEPTKPAGMKPVKSKYKIVRGKKFTTKLDGISLKPSLLNKITRMANYALENDLVSANIVFSSGMRSRKKAHLWSTAYQIRQGKVPLEKLKALQDGKDKDGNTWYEPEWTDEQIKENARNVWAYALAAEGYQKEDEHRKPNTFKGGVTRHATGWAVDMTFVWSWSKGDQQKVKDKKALDAIKAEVRKKFAGNKKKRDNVLAEIDKFIARGSYSEVAFKTVKDFGLKRPLLHAISSPEDWHYEEK